VSDEAKDKALKEALEPLLRKSAVLKRVFSTEEGREALEILRREFTLKLEAKEEHGIVFKAGRCDAYNWIMQMLNLTPEGR
jgi:hypothetical protein